MIRDGKVYKGRKRKHVGISTTVEDCSRKKKKAKERARGRLKQDSCRVSVVCGP